MVFWINGPLGARDRYPIPDTWARLQDVALPSLTYSKFISMTFIDSKQYFKLFQVISNIDHIFMSTCYCQGSVAWPLATTDLASIGLILVVSCYIQLIDSSSWSKCPTHPEFLMLFLSSILSLVGFYQHNMQGFVSTSCFFQPNHGMVTPWWHRKTRAHTWHFGTRLPAVFAGTLLRIDKSGAALGDVDSIPGGPWSSGFFWSPNSWDDYPKVSGQKLQSKLGLFAMSILLVSNKNGVAWRTQYIEVTRSVWPKKSAGFRPEWQLFPSDCGPPTE